METRAYLKGTRLSPQKAALVADQIRGKKIDEAMDFLTFNKQKGSAVIKKLLESAIANAENNHQLDIDKLVVKEATVGKSMVLKRFRPRARGRSGKILKPFSKVKILVQEKEKEKEKEKNNNSLEEKK